MSAPAEVAPGQPSVGAAPAPRPPSVGIAPAPRQLAIWWPDWPVTAAVRALQLELHKPIAIHDGQRITAVSALARAEGVRRGQRRRTAQGFCPELDLVTVDEGRDVRLFEAEVGAIETVLAEVEILRPGLLLAPARGPSRFFGGERALAEALVGAVVERTGVDCQVGVADGSFAAILAVRSSLAVPEGSVREFLDPLGIGLLEHGQPLALAAGVSVSVDECREFIGLLSRLGLRTLRDFAELPQRDVASRFGAAAVVLHRLASGVDERPQDRRRPPEDLAVSVELDPPAERIDAAAFAARRLAEEFHAQLRSGSQTCARLRVEVQTVSGDELNRTWRHEGELDAAGITDRVRWQLEGWLSGRSGLGPSSALTRIRLLAEDIIPTGALQGELWSSTTVDDQRAHRVLTRAQHLLGPESVLTPVRQGGRGPLDQIRLVAWGDERVPLVAPDRPWPGRLPSPSPATVYEEPLRINVLDDARRTVSVTARGELTGDPAWLEMPPDAFQITAWAGPWPVAEKWWSADTRRVRFQLMRENAPPVLAVVERGVWHVEACYD